MTVKPEHAPCSLIKAISGVLGTLLVIISIYIAFQEGRIRQLESKNDSIVRMQRDMEYLTDSVKEVKADMKTLLKRSPDVSMYSIMDAEISRN